MDIDSIVMGLLPQALVDIAKDLPVETRQEVANAYLRYVIKHRIPLDWPLCPCYFMKPEENPIKQHLGFYLGGYSHAFVMDPETEEYKGVVSDFMKENPDFEVCAITKHVNPLHLSRYHYKARELATFFNAPLNEKQVYHSSHIDSVCKIQRDGLDLRMGRGGYFGVGIYGTDDPDKSANYWRGPRCLVPMCMFRVKMNLGRCISFPKSGCNPKLRTLPDAVHSVLGNITGEDEYVVYDNSQTCIEYAIYYWDKGHSEKKIVLPPNINRTDERVTSPFDMFQYIYEMPEKTQSKMLIQVTRTRRSQRIASARLRVKPY